MKAAVLISTGKDREIRLMDFSTCPELQIGQVLVKVHYAGICGAQVNEIMGRKGEDKYLPHMFGHEGSGEVMTVGPGVRKVKPGDRVVLHWRKGSGIDAVPAKWVSDSGIAVGSGPVSCFSEYTIVSENRVTTVIAKQNGVLSMKVAALMGCAITTGFGIVYKEANIKPGEDVLVIGCGGVGASVILAASKIAAYVQVWERQEAEEKRMFAFSLGAASFELGPTEDLFDVVIETTGSPLMIRKGLEAVRPGKGRLILCGQPRKGVSVTFPDMSQHYFGKKIIDSQGGDTDPDYDIPRYMRLNDSMFEFPTVKGFDYFRLIDKIGSLNDIDEMMEDMINGKVMGRCLIQM